MPALTSNPLGRALNLQRVFYSALALIAWSALAFGAGYAYKWHRDSLADAKVEARRETVVATVKAAAAAVDTQALVRLKATLATANTRAAALEQTIKDQSNATPAIAACRLPDGLREQINADLATGSP